jgi:hypothetical protein
MNCRESASTALLQMRIAAREFAAMKSPRSHFGLVNARDTNPKRDSFLREES